MAKSLQGQTMRNKSNIRRVRKFGFLKRMRKWTGRNTIKNRRRKKRKKLSPSREFGSKMKKNKIFSRR